MMLVFVFSFVLFGCQQTNIDIFNKYRVIRFCLCGPQPSAVGFTESLKSHALYSSHNS